MSLCEESAARDGAAAAAAFVTVSRPQTQARPTSGREIRIRHERQIVMRTTAPRTLSLLVTLLCVCASIVGQQPTSPSIDELKQQIQQLLAVDRDTSTPAEVKDLNQQFIIERRRQLSVLLQKKVDALQKYQAAVSASLTAGEKQEVQNSIAAAQAELLALSGETQAGHAPSGTNGHMDAAGTNGQAVAPLAQEAPAAPVEPPLKPKPQPLSTGDIQRSLRASAAPGSATQETPRVLDRQLETDKNDIISRIISARKNPVLRQRAGNRIFLRNPLFFARILSTNVLPRQQFTREIEDARVDEQVGGGSNSGGSTSLVSKGSIPAVLGFAVENGGLTRTDQGTSINFRGNFVGLAEALAGKGFIDSYDDDSLTIRRLRKLSFAISYDTSLGDQVNVFVGNRQQLSAYSFRYEFYNRRDPRDPRYANRWADLINNNAQAIALDLNNIQILFRENAILNAWSEGAAAAINAAPDEDVARVVGEQLDALLQLELPANVKDSISSFSQDFINYRQKKSALLDLVANGPIFTTEYVNNRRPGLIDTSSFNFIYGTGLAEGKLNFTFNAAATLFNSKPAAGIGRMRNFDFSTQFDLPLGDSRGFGQFVLSFAGQYKRLLEDEMMASGMMMRTKGDIATGNLKLEIPIRNLGMKIPLSFTFNNRTEFDFKKQLRGNFGLTFDPDTLFSLLSPFTRRR
ncbi:MAG: hypothetical protein QOD32_1838 [Pyrinomonadaceae bacterium]|jgi:hypothetical protein|nr:hypothetical protein [Pyrinomonadaceae bacterium]